MDNTVTAHANAEADTTLPTDGDDAGEIERLGQLVAEQRQAFLGDMNPDLDVRLGRVDLVERLVLENQDRIIEALLADFGSHAPELTRITEVMGPVTRARYTRRHLKSWMKPERRAVDRKLFGLARNSVVHQPVGVVGNMAPWNFPIDLSIGPLIDILGAGNRAVIKPSEHAPHSGRLVAELVAETFQPDVVAVVTGGRALAEAFAATPWDHLLFTGGPEIGRQVMAAAARNLTPVTLELGGKNPTIIAPDAVNAKTVTAILATKMVKAGQMCITSDHLFVPRSRMADFVELAQAAMAELYPRVIDNGDSAAIINDRHVERLRALRAEAEANERAEVVELNPAGEADSPETRKLVPALILDPDDDLGVMTEEIFGPLLPVKPYDDLDEVLAHINAGERPLALSIFSGDSDVVDRIVANTLSGGVTVNAVALHAMQASLPFGGIGRSGMGHHHGREGFIAFSKARPIFTQAPIDGSALLYPPYGKAINRLLDFFLPRSR